MLSEIDTRPFPAVPAAFNLASHVLAAGARQGFKPALIVLHPDQDETIGYAELLSLTRGCASALLAAGLAPGDRILMRIGNGIAFPIVFLGALWAGLVPVVSSPALTEAEITRLAALVAPRLVIGEAGVPLPVGFPRVKAPDLASWITRDTTEPHLGDAEREGYVVFTSGSSGMPMGVSHAHRAILARSAMHQAWESIGPSDRLLHAGALNWTFTLGTGLLDPWIVGATAMIPAPGTRPADLPALLSRSEATIFASAPGVIRQMLRAPFPALPKLRHGLCAGEALAGALRADWQQKTGTDLHEALGLSEISTFVSGSRDRPAPNGSAGFVQPGRHVAVLGSDGKPVPRGEIGELAVSVRDPGLMRGYIGQPAPKGPWFRTGDAASMDRDGAITHHGRLDDLMNPGGFRVGPAEVETAFEGLEGLTACAATEVEPRPGTRIIALFYEAPCEIDVTRLRQRAEKALARWKQPRHYQRLDALPRTGNGKIIRRALAAAYRKDET
ncbi:MAG: acyl--CoA ligase [Tabrizicola sp.]|nr:acyl--CoA ligase [Tabrizicola sp.]